MTKLHVNFLNWVYSFVLHFNPIIMKTAPLNLWLQGFDIRDLNFTTSLLLSSTLLWLELLMGAIWDICNHIPFRPVCKNRRRIVQRYWFGNVCSRESQTTQIWKWLIFYRRRQVESWTKSQTSLPVTFPTRTSFVRSSYTLEYLITVQHLLNVHNGKLDFKWLAKKENLMLLNWW